MSAWQVSLAIFRKDLVAERRRKDVFNIVFLFGFTVVVAFSYAFEPGAEESRGIAGGLLWLAFLFASVLGLNQSFARATANGCLDGLRLIPVEAGALYAGMLLSNFVFLLLAEAVLLPVFGVFFNLNLWARPAELALVLFLGTWGVASLGTILAAVSANTRIRELLLPLFLLPLAVPVLVVAIEATSLLIAGRPLAEAAWGLKLLTGFDIIFSVLGWLLFDFVLEE